MKRAAVTVSPLHHGCHGKPLQAFFRYLIDFIGAQYLVIHRF
jgi:hypothetical protein